MFGKALMRGWSAAALVASAVAAQAVTIDLVPVGDAGNVADTTGYGSVAYPYLIGKYEVTAGQYTAFLNAVAKTDTYGLYDTSMAEPSVAWGCNIQRSGSSGTYAYSVASDWANRPVTWVSFWDAARFTNWLNNGQPTGMQDVYTTEHGAYTLNGYNGDDGRSIARNNGARWFIPSENEWYKAAHYAGGGINASYWTYPTRSNSPPVAELPPGRSEPPGSASYASVLSLTDVGAYVQSPGPYGTYDQAGNVWEWNDTVTHYGTYRGLRGAAVGRVVRDLSATGSRNGGSPIFAGNGTDAVGFRVASAPFDWHNVANYNVSPPACQPIERLRKWDGANWVPVCAGDLALKKVHVLVHGWAPGLRDFADDKGAIWESSKGGHDNSFMANELTETARAIKVAAPDQEVVAFNWVDLSATPRPPNDPWFLLEARQSRNNVKEGANQLVDALKVACERGGQFLKGPLHMLGLSHGAGVVAYAARHLYRNDHTIVEHLTLGDSPDEGLARTPIFGARNNLAPIFENGEIRVGRGPEATFVDNYYSSDLGGPYYDTQYPMGRTNQYIVNVDLNPTGDYFSKHVYPLRWYRGATLATTNIALAWSPLMGENYQTLGKNYVQEGAPGTAGEYFLRDTGSNEVVPIELRTSLHLATLLSENNVVATSNGVCLTEASSSYWHALLTKGADDVAIEFSYQFLNPGDGDQLGIWIDDELRFILTGLYQGTAKDTSMIDVSDLATGDHILSVALHSYGAPGASVEVGDFAMISVPEPSTLALLGVGAIGLLGWAWRRRKQIIA